LNHIDAFVLIAARVFILLPSESVVFAQGLIIQCFVFVSFFPDFYSLIPLSVYTLNDYASYMNNLHSNQASLGDFF